MSEAKPKKLMNKDNLIIGIIVAVIILAVAGIMCYYFLFMDKEVIATYDNGEVTRGEYEMYYRLWAPVLAYYYGSDNETIAMDVAEKVILDRLILKDAAEAGIEADKEEVDTLLSDKANIEAFASRGLNIDALKGLLYDDSVVNLYMTKLQEKATAEKVKEYITAKEGEDTDLNLYNTRHILFSIAEASTDEEKAAVKKEAEEVLAKVKKGEDFAKLANEYSDDTYTQQYSEGKYVASSASTVPSYVNAVKKLKKGEVTSALVVDETYGYFIIKLEEVVENGRLTDSNEVSYYVNEMLDEKQTAAKCEYDEERIKEIANSIAVELGLISTAPSTEATK
ncbi:MAG: peptidylprolyl isomerase [Clostridia bacterium]|nr:peptidylprolyl isomerase [Clostridia bacterium]